MSAEAFWAGVSAYNEALWPVQAVLVIVAAFLTWRLIAKPGPRTDVWMKACLSFAFAWNGILVFPFYLRNPISMAIGTPLFVLVAILFALAIWAQKTAFRLPGTRWGRALARQTTTLHDAMYLVGTVYNFCAYHKSLRVPLYLPNGRRRWLRRTPAIAAGITDHLWTVHELLSFRVPPPPWKPPKRRGRPSNATKALVARWCS